MRDSSSIRDFPARVRGRLAEGQLGDCVIEDGLDLEAYLLRGRRMLVLTLVPL